MCSARAARPNQRVVGICSSRKRIASPSTRSRPCVVTRCQFDTRSSKVKSGSNRSAAGSVKDTKASESLRSSI